MVNRRYGWHSGVAHCRSVKSVGSSVLADSTIRLGAGTSQALAVQNSVAGTRLMGVYMNSTVNGGDQRAAYFRLWSSGGTSTSGEAVRAYHSCEGITGAVHGIHASVAYATSMYCNNEAIAVRGTIEMPNSTVSQGSYYGVQSEFYTNGASSVLSGTGAAFFRCIVTGSEANAPAALEANAKMYLFDFSNTSGTNYITAGSGKFIDTDKTSGTHYGGLRVKLPGGTTGWIALVSA